MNKRSVAKEHLHYQCSVLKKKFSLIPGMELYLSSSFNQAEQCCEQQALALSQDSSKENRLNSEYRSSVISSGFSIHSDNSVEANGNSNGAQNNSSSTLMPNGNSSVANYNKKLTNNNIFTFTAGVLPANISVDPVTQVWKLFQRGDPLCLLFNKVCKDYQIPIQPSSNGDDMKTCKKAVYDFIIAVTLHIDLSKLSNSNSDTNTLDDDDEDEPEMFTISNVFSDSTSDLLKVINVVNRLMDLDKAFFKLDDNFTVPDIVINDDRSKAFKELVETERKFVSDLELLQKYKQQLVNAEIITNEQIQILLPNINEIIEFQRRLLNGLECNVNVPYKYQRIGSIFIHASNGPFKSYEPWTIAQLQAIELVTKEAANLRRSLSLLDPGFELQSFLIKPIQRLCKYPLLLDQMIKYSPESLEDPTPLATFGELLLARQAMKEVANEINEAQRRAENVEFLRNLTDRVQNWRGFELRDQGNLLYHGTVGVRDQDNEKEYQAYLFERIIFFFVDTANPGNTENNSSTSSNKKMREILSSRKKSQASTSTANLLENLNSTRDKSVLELKGRVYISEIYNFSTANVNNGYTLMISWSGRKENGSFTLRYKTEEARNQWEHYLRQLKTADNNNSTVVSKRVRDSHGSQATNDSYDLTAAYLASSDANSSRSSSGSQYQRHHSSSSTLSMLKGARRSKSNGTIESSYGNGSSSRRGSVHQDTPVVGIKLIYNKIEIPGLLNVSQYIAFPDLQERISILISLSQVVTEDIVVNKMKYKDEDGDFVVLELADDWNLAVDMLQEMAQANALTIFVL
ncbi:uncharacterized protein KQ657_003758 [Scheffersomyces spartinae]|uniref:Uncharacterized protein n=1 Tax=Scheffersomyces spartinae TaxID=45513 RepID=A0A9P7VCA6_9ASCO|nr:uncharacterized protein KQ657_003758 [Scheffersomyces spartinae]KAG7195232.1 hypothetical protein KQ657_003758 [Scheffersomyces spartinae]